LLFSTQRAINRAAKERNPMARTRKQPKTYNGFAIPLQPDTDLGLAMLIAESEDGQHEPVAVVGTISEAREVAQSDLGGRMRRLEPGEEPGICPYTYKLWARAVDGDYRLACEIAAADL
jgi:hypothetical protein